MKRRDFLKILGIAPAVAAVPALAKADAIRGYNTEGIQVYPDRAHIKGNNFDSNFTKKVAKEFLEKFEESRVMSEQTITIRRPLSYRTAKGEETI